jgi:hypothetical protein
MSASGSLTAIGPPMRHVGFAPDNGLRGPHAQGPLGGQKQTSSCFYSITSSARAISIG